MDKIPEPLSPRDKDEFTFFTASVRWPAIMVKLLDFFHRTWNVFLLAKYGKMDVIEKKKAEEESKSIVGAFSKLRFEIMTDKKIKLLSGSETDISIWNQYYQNYLTKFDCEPSYFTASWLYGECYMYRKVQEILETSKYFVGFDPFHDQKRQGLKNLMQNAVNLAQYLYDLEKNEKPRSEKEIYEECVKFIEISLWGNKCDLAMAERKVCLKQTGFFFDLSKLRSNIVINDIKILIETLTKMNIEPTPILDIVTDNAGFEIFCDFCMLEAFQILGLLPKNKAKVRFHLKKMPWFVSDATKEDFMWVIYYLSNYSENEEKSEVIRILGKKFRSYVESGYWTLHTDDFWTLPYDYSRMKTISPELYNQLSEADLIIFKGDLNYRKLVGDLKWDKTKPFFTALRGFNPSSFCSLRTIKAEVILGLKEGSWKKYPSNWMYSSDYALIQFCSNLTN